MLFGYNHHSNYTQRDCVLKISTLLLSILCIGLTGCEDKKPESAPDATENTTEVFTQKSTEGQQDKRFQLSKKKGALVDISKAEKIEPETFTLDANHTVTVSDQKLIFHKNEQPIVIVNVFATWCPPCIGAISSLNDLQKKHKNELFISGIITHDLIDKPKLRTFISKHQINYFISNSTDNDAFVNLLTRTLRLAKNFSIPLTVMYVDGEYFTHYEGIIPIEMIEYDIEQAKKQLRPR